MKEYLARQHPSLLQKLEMSARISSTRHIVRRGPLLTLAGKRPDLTPAHQHDFFTGMIGGIGGSAVASPMICLRRRKPVWGSELTFFSSLLLKTRSFWTVGALYGTLGPESGSALPLMEQPLSRQKLPSAGSGKC
jgi:hypothetical protein